MSRELTGKALIAATQVERQPWPKLRVPKASGILAGDLRREIIRNRLPVGTDLPGETTLIERTGYSRGTVREALRLLEVEGLITTRRGPQGGVRVSRPDTSQATRSIAVLLALSDVRMRELFHFRRYIEKEAARLAAEHATEEQVQAMLDAVRDDERETVEGVVSFHTLVAQACGNEFFTVTLTVILQIAEWHTPQEGLNNRDICVARESHELVVNHIAAGRGDEAAEAMDAHLLTFEKVVRKQGNLDAPVLRPENWSSNY
jgi:GntR family transcriptional repressor for pyruvate dehydrogenase complex